MRFLKWVLVLLAAGVVFVSALIGMVSWRAGVARTAEPSDCIIVLGARVHMSGRLSDALRYRCESALEAYREGLSENIIVSGARGSDEPTTEAEAMRDWFVKNGVPEEHIFLEPDSTDTWENLQFSQAIMREHGWQSAIISTNDYHLERSMWIARDLGIDVTGIAAESPKPPSVKWSNRAREAGRILTCPMTRRHTVQPRARGRELGRVPAPPHLLTPAYTKKPAHSAPVFCRPFCMKPRHPDAICTIMSSSAPSVWA